MLAWKQITLSVLCCVQMPARCTDCICICGYLLMMSALWSCEKDFVLFSSFSGVVEKIIAALLKSKTAGARACYCCHFHQAEINYPNLVLIKGFNHFNWITFSGFTGFQAGGNQAGSPSVAAISPHQYLRGCHPLPRHEESQWVLG